MQKRDVGANAFFRVISTPWERERKFHFYFGISFIFTALFGKYFSYFCLIEAFLTIRSMSNNTKAYQGKWNSLEIISETSDNRLKGY